MTVNMVPLEWAGVISDWYDDVTTLTIPTSMPTMNQALDT
jgi:hypothetical protein